jgi:hypothetical protein
VLLERPASFPTTVPTPWERSLAAVFGHQSAAELLSLCAFLPMDAIPRHALAEYDPLELDEAIATRERVPNAWNRFPSHFSHVVATLATSPTGPRKSSSR